MITVREATGGDVAAIREIFLASMAKAESARGMMNFRMWGSSDRDVIPLVAATPSIVHRVLHAEHVTMTHETVSNFATFDASIVGLCAGLNRPDAACEPGA